MSSRTCRSRAAVIVLLTLISLPWSASVFADTVYHTVFVVDKSGSMGSRLDWLAAVIDVAYRAEERNLNAVPSEFGLVLYSRNALVQHFDDELFGSLEDVVAALSSVHPSRSGQPEEEDGYVALETALEAYRDHLAGDIEFVLVSDEDRDVVDSRATFERVMNEFVRAGVKLDTVVDARFTCADGRMAVAMTDDGNGLVQSTDDFSQCLAVTLAPSRGDNASVVSDYVALTQALGGTVWRIGAFRDDGQLRVEPIEPGRRLNESKRVRLMAFAPAFRMRRQGQIQEQFPTVIVALASASPKTIAPGELVTFSAAGSHPADSTAYITDWRWDFDNDGVVDAWGDVVVTSFESLGEHAVVLQVFDGAGNQARARAVVTVR